MLPPDRGGGNDMLTVCFPETLPAKQKTKKMASQGQSAVDEAFLAAVSADKRSAVAMLLEDGASVNAVTKSGNRSALHLAVDASRLALMDVLLGVSGVDVNARDVVGLTPLHLACAFGDVEAARRLLAAGADVNAADDGGLTPLHSAAFFGRLPVCELLVEQPGLRAELLDREGRTAVQIAQDSGNFILVGLLKSRTREPEPVRREPPAQPPRTASPPPAAAAAVRESGEDLTWTPTDTYGSLKRKLERANALIARLRAGAAGVD